VKKDVEGKEAIRVHRGSLRKAHRASREKAVRREPRVRSHNSQDHRGVLGIRAKMVRKGWVECRDQKVAAMMVHREMADHREM
jgi:hypothetical protein